MWWRLLWWVISYALSDYFREKLPAQTASGLGDFNVPTATEGRSVPIILGGSVKCRSLNCIWYGDFAAVERTVTTGVIFKRDEVIGFTYELALCYAAVKGEVAGIKAVWVGDDKVWDSVADNGGLPATSFVDIDRDDLFGGVDNGGGFVGRIRLFNGSETQGTSAFLDARVDNNPAYRGTAYIMVTDLTESFGANIGEAANLRYISIELQAFDTVANGGLGDVLNLNNDHHFIGDDANPVSIAYDLYVNQRWGRNFPAGDMNLTNFKSVAETIWSEGLGYTQLVDEQTTTGDIQDNLEQHMDAYIGPNPITGQIEIKLARFDYVLANQFQANPGNIISVPKWNKGDWSQTVNRVRLRYSDRAKEWNETHAVAIASGNRIIQGKTITKEIRYQGVHTAAVANLIAARDLRNLAQPTSSGTIEIDRTAYALRPGDVFSFTSLKVNEADLAVRVTRAGVGNTIKNQMQFDVTADVFNTEITNVADPPPTDFVPPTQGVLPFGVTEQAAFEAPFILMRYDEAAPNSVPRIATMAKRPLGSTPTEYEVVRRVRNPPTAFAGVYVSTDFVTQGFTTVGLLRNNETDWASGNGGLSMQLDPIGAESLDALIASDYTPGPGNARGIAVISPGLADEEFIIFDAIVDDLAGIRLENVWRACMDTPWKAHSAGAQIWFPWTGGLGMGSETYNIGDGVDMRFLPRSPTDSILDTAATSLPEVSIDEFTGPRNSKPLLPISMTINLQVFPAAVDFEYLIVAGPNAGVAGSENFPTLRAWNNQNILGSVLGLDIAQGGFNPSDVTEQGLELAWWLHDLDTNPTGLRADAVASSAGYIAQATANDQFDVLKSAIIAGGAEGFSFNARLEIETRHSPNGQVPLQLSHDTMDLDFVASGIFTVPAASAFFQTHLDGVDTATVSQEVSSWGRPIDFIGNAQIDTAQSVFGGASLLLDGTGDSIQTPARSGFDMRGDFTLEARLWFNTEPSFPMLFEQWDGTVDRGIQVYYNAASNQFNFNFSTNGVNLFSSVAHSGGTFIPTLSTWYAFALVKKGTLWSCYIDGTRIGSPLNQASVYFRSSLDFIFGGGGDGTNFFDGNFDEIRMTPAALYSEASYTVAILRDQDGRSTYPLLCHFDDTDAVTTHTEDSPNHFTLTFTGTSAIDTAQFKFGTASALFNGVNNFATPALQDGADIVETLPGLTDAAFDFKRGDFTLEGFFRLNALPSTNPAESAGFTMIAKAHRATSGGFDWYMGLPSTNTGLYFSRSPTGSVASQQVASATIPTLVVDGVWRHWAIVRSGNDLNIYYEGLRVLQTVDFFAASPDMWNNDSPSGGHNKVTIGYLGGLGSASSTRKRAFNGWLDEINVEKRAIYNGSSYTIPAAPNPTPNDSLSIPADDYAILWSGNGPSDAYATDWELRTEDTRGVWIGFGNQAQIDTGVTGAFGGSSTKFDGNGDFVQMSRSLTMYMDGDDFTIEGRMWFLTAPSASGFGGHNMIGQWLSTGNLRGFHLTVEDSNELAFHWSTDGINDKKVFAPFTPNLSQWYHIAVVRSGTSVFLFVDGVELVNDGASDAITTDIIFNPQRVLTFGHANDTGVGGFHYLNGNINAFAWTRSAKWVAGFTPPVALYTPPAVPYH